MSNDWITDEAGMVLGEAYWVWAPGEVAGYNPNGTVVMMGAWSLSFICADTVLYAEEVFKAGGAFQHIPRPDAPAAG